MTDDPRRTARSVASDDLIDQLIAEAPGAVPESTELERILAIPRRPQPVGATPEWLIDYMTKFLTRERTDPCRCPELGHPCVTRLNDAQAAALFEAPRAGGSLGLLGVGSGKSLLNILLPMVFPTCRRALLLIPPNLRAQFFNVDFPLYSQHFRTPILAGSAPPWDPALPVLHVMAYSELSQAKSTAAIEALDPDLVVADEGHNLRNRMSARGGRVLRYLASNPRVKFCTHSGTLSKNSITNYSHLAYSVLRKKSPIPIDPKVLEAWAEAIDPVPNPAPMGQLARLCNPGEHIRAAFQRRLHETAGVLATSESKLGTGLEFSRRTPPPIPAELKGVIQNTRDNDERPDGDPLTDDFARSKCLRELACGFFYRWRFPRGEKREVIEEWLAVRKVYMKEVRDFLKYSPREHLDSPLLLWLAAQRWHEGYRAPSHEVQARITALLREANEHEELAEETDSLAEGADRLQAAAHLREEAKRLSSLGVVVPPRTAGGPLTVWASSGWPDWKRMREQVKPETEAVWVSDWLVKDAVEWGKERPGIIWYDHVTYGEAVAREGKFALYGGGEKASAEILKEVGKRTIVASISAHGTGKNLQHAFWRNLVANPPSDDEVMEQLVGRTHRQGQPADTVTVEYYAHTREFAGSIAKARELAAFNAETTKNARKLLYGTWIR